MSLRTFAAILVGFALVAGCAEPGTPQAKPGPSGSSTETSACALGAADVHPYFPLAAGHRLVLLGEGDEDDDEDEEDDEDETEDGLEDEDEAGDVDDVDDAEDASDEDDADDEETEDEEGALVQEVYTVLDRTEVVDGVTTRVVEETDTDGDERAFKFFATCAATGDVWLLGEDDGEGGSWRAGTGGAERMLALPGVLAAGQSFPGEEGSSIDVVAVGVSVTVPAGTFADAVHLRITEADEDEEDDADEEDDEDETEDGLEDEDEAGDVDDVDDAEGASDEDDDEDDEDEAAESEEDDEAEDVYLARGVGLVREGDLLLVAYGSAGSFEIPAVPTCFDDDAYEDDVEDVGDEDELEDECADGEEFVPPTPSFAESRDNCTFATTGNNPFFLLQVGWTLVLKGTEDGEPIQATITVLNETKVVDGVETRVVLEEELEDGELVEKSWNYFASCVETGSVFYFGEDVDEYDEGTLEGHPGRWLAGAKGAEAGIVMPGTPTLGWKGYQEHAPNVALDFAEIVGVNETVTTPAGTFTGAIKVKETTELEPDDVEYKWYAPGVGVVVDGPLSLTAYGAGP